MYSFQSKIRYSEIDKDGYLSLEAMMNYFQDCSAMQSEELGVCIDYQRQRQFTWMLLQWHVQIFKKPKYGETIVVGTWPYSFKNIKGGRNFVMQNTDGDTLVRADSEWVRIDLEKNRIAKIPEELVKIYKMEPPLEMGEVRKKFDADDTVEIVDKVTVTPFFLDTNGHVNNVKYLSVVEGYMRDFSYNEFRVEYRNQAFLQDEIGVASYMKDGCKRFVLKNQKEELLVNIEFGNME